MPIISHVCLFERPSRIILFIRKRVSFSNLSEFAASSFPSLFDYAEKKGALLTDYPYICYHNDIMENLDVEAGICISKKLCNSGQIECAAVRPEKGASGLFLGPYEQSDPLMNEIKEWIKSNGYKSKGVIFNYFLNDTARAQEELLTKIAIPVDRE